MDNNEAVLVNDNTYVDLYNKGYSKGVSLKKLSKSIYNIFKRFCDIIISVIGLIFLLPISIIVKILFILSGDKDTIFFKQERTGKNGKNFKLIKFRSMKINNDVRDFSKEDEFTKVGKFLRKTSLDELPQLINIFKGEMTFVGPRPWIPEYYENMNEIQKHRCDVIPGVTGLAQVNGRNGISIIDKINIDLMYVRDISLILDMKIIYRTIKTVFKKEHAYINKMGIKEEIEELKKQNKI